MAFSAENSNSVNQTGAMLYPRAEQRREEKGAKKEAARVEKAVKKELRRVNKYWNAGFKLDMVLVAPHGTKLTAGSKLDRSQVGKVPTFYDKNGCCSGAPNWVEEPLPEQQAKRGNAVDDCGVGVKGRDIPGLDCDSENVALCELADRIADKHLGLSPNRGRENSRRFLRAYKRKAGAPPISSWAIKLTDKDGDEHLIELKADKTFWVADGTHKSGVPYCYVDGADLCVWGRENLSEIDEVASQAFKDEFLTEAQALGFRVVSTKGARATGARAGARKPIGSPELAASNPADVLALLRAVPCNEETFETRDAFVAALAAVKASLGEAADDFWPIVLEWALQYPGAEEDYIRNIWSSIHDAEVGFSRLEGWARSHGYNEDAQRAFADTPQPGADTPAVDPESLNGAIPKNALDRMVGCFIYCTHLDRYFDTRTRGFISEKSVNVCSTDVAAYGRTGTNSAAAQFQNHPDVRRVVVPTYRPGQPILITEAGKAAVNTWCPSNVVPAQGVTDADVQPWLTLIGILFGNDTLEREHFLNWWAHNFQKPGHKIGHAIVLTSGQGFGKDTALRPLFEGLGTPNVASIDTTALASPFNYYVRFQIVYVQEAKTSGHRDLYNYLKPFISAQTTWLAVNEKNLPQYFVPNIQNWIVTSNHDNALALEDDDRRFWVHRAVAEEAPPDDFFIALHAWYEAGGTEKVAGWLLQRDLSGFNPMAKPPITAAKRAMLELSQPAPVRWLREKLKAGGSLADRRVVTVRELRNTGHEWDAPERPTEKHAAVALKAEGFKAAHRVRLGKDVERLWARGVDGSTTADAMRALYRTETEGASCKAA